MNIPLSQFPHQPGTLQCCRECDSIPRNERDCNVIPTSCIDFCIANHDFIEQKRVEASLAAQVQEIERGGVEQ